MIPKLNITFVPTVVVFISSKLDTFSFTVKDRTLSMVTVCPRAFLSVTLILYSHHLIGAGVLRVYVPSDSSLSTKALPSRSAVTSVSHFSASTVKVISSELSTESGAIRVL